MQLIGKYEIVEYAYKTHDEMLKHQEVLNAGGWKQDSVFIDTKTQLCAKYIKTGVSECQYVKDVITGVSANRVVIKCFDKIIYNDLLEYLVKGERVMDRLLQDRLVISQSVQNGILTLVVQ